jgi:hypothetical protein
MRHSRNHAVPRRVLIAAPASPDSDLAFGLARVFREGAVAREGSNLNELPSITSPD